MHCCRWRKEGRLVIKLMQLSIQLGLRGVVLIKLQHQDYNRTVKSGPPDSPSPTLYEKNELNEKSCQP